MAFCKSEEKAIRSSLPTKAFVSLANVIPPLANLSCTAYAPPQNGFPHARFWAPTAPAHSP
jgi:hypothetical protein